MTTAFLFCAVVGGTVLVCQFVLTLVGLGGHGDVADDFSGDVGTGDVGTDFHDVFGGDAHVGDVHAGSAHGHDPNGQNHQSSWLFGIISFRTLVAAATFFGLAGMMAQAAEMNLGPQLLIALACGAAAMYGVHWIMLTIGRLGEDGTIRIQRALGQEATVYIPIPAAGAQAGGVQAGKVQLKLQNRLVEYEAVTSGPTKWPTGAKVRVVGMTGNTLQVEPLQVAPVKATEPVA
jgi:hypothetical protein